MTKSTIKVVINKYLFEHLSYAYQDSPIPERLSIKNYQKHPGDRSTQTRMSLILRERVGSDKSLFIFLNSANTKKSKDNVTTTCLYLI